MLARLTRRPSPTTVRRLALASIVANSAIVVTGGAVRLTASGLGCPTWPRCTETSYIPTAEYAVHGVIEFGNRLLTFVLGAVVLAVLVAVWRQRPVRPDMRLLALLGFLGIPAQAVLGGITVLTGLNPWTVMGHFLLSMVLIALAVVLHRRAGEGDLAPRPVVPPAMRGLTQGLLAVTALTLVLGTVVTGSGPHSGDPAAGRTGLDPATVSQLHADSVMLLVGLTVALYVGLRAEPLGDHRREPVGSARFGREEQRRLGELELDQQRATVGAGHDVDPAVQQRTGERHRGQGGVGHRSLRGRRRARRDGDVVGVVELGHEHRPLAGGVAVHAAEGEHRRLAVGVDGGQVRLHHDGAPGPEQVPDVCGGVLPRRVPGGVPRPGRHRRLDDVLAVRRRVAVARLHPRRGDDRHAGGGEVAQVALVGVPGEHGGRVLQSRHRAGPVEELLAPRHVVPGVAHHHQVEGGPVDRGVVPDGGHGGHAGRGEGRDEQCVVLVEVGQLPAGGQRHPRSDGRAHAQTNWSSATARNSSAR